MTMKNEMLLVKDTNTAEQKMIGGIILPSSAKSDQLNEAIIISSYNQSQYQTGITVVYEPGYNKKYIDQQTKEVYKIINSKNVLMTLGE